MRKSIMRSGSILTEIAAGIVIIVMLVAFLLPYFKDTVGQSVAAQAVRSLNSMQGCDDVAAVQETER